MPHTFYTRILLVALLAAGTTACGQKGPLVQPPRPPGETQPVPGVESGEENEIPWHTESGSSDEF